LDKTFCCWVTWAGLVTIYPVVFGQIQGQPNDRPLLNVYPLLLIQNFLFITVVALLFDIKDYKNDLYYQLKTPAVILGIRKTIRFIIFPAIAISLIASIMLQRSANFSASQSAVQLIPYLFLVAVSVNSGSKKSLMFYLFAVDGLVFAKALCGITSLLFFKKPTHV
jgi:4-hydroxybenzoate polyprenyltransferase